MRGMSRYDCPDYRDHERKAERDANYGSPSYDYYDRYSDDACKQVYTEAYDREPVGVGRVV